MQAMSNHEANPPGENDQTRSLLSLNQRLVAAAQAEVQQQQQQQQQRSSSLLDLFSNQQNRQGVATHYLNRNLASFDGGNNGGSGSLGRGGGRAATAAALQNQNQLLYSNMLNQAQASSPSVQRNLPESFTLAESLASLQSPVPSGTRAALEAAIRRENAMMRERILLARGGATGGGSVGCGSGSLMSLSSRYGSLLSNCNSLNASIGQRGLVERSLQLQRHSDSTASSRNSISLGTQEGAAGGGLARLLGGGSQRPTPTQSLSVGQPPQSGGNFPSCLPCVLAVPEDNHKLSSHQVLLRNQIEVFNASEDDLSTHKRGRNKPVKLGQVGIRCRHCAHLSVARRQKGSTYFPASLHGIYQASQNMNTTHMQSGLCTEMPSEMKQQFAEATNHKASSSVAGRAYWKKQAFSLGLIDTPDYGIRFVRDLTVSQIAQLKQET